MRVHITIDQCAGKWNIVGRYGSRDIAFEIEVDTLREVAEFLHEWAQL